MHVTGPTAILACSLLSIGVAAHADGLYRFNCGDRGSMLVNSYAGAAIGKVFHEAQPSDGKGFERLLTVPVRCGTASLFCLREGIDPRMGLEQTHVFAFPKRLHAGEHYEVEGYAFSVGAFHRNASGLLATDIEVIPSRNLSGHYTLRVEDRHGLVGIRFESLIGPANVRRKAARHFGTVDCMANAKEPSLFSGVRLIERGGNP